MRDEHKIVLALSDALLELVPDDLRRYATIALIADDTGAGARLAELADHFAKAREEAVGPDDHDERGE